MRAAPNYADTRNPPATTQDFGVVLTDTAGRKASVAAAPYASGALVPSRGSVQREIVLGGIRIPLAAFRRIDLAHLAEHPPGIRRPNRARIDRPRRHRLAGACQGRHRRSSSPGYEAVTAQVPDE
jgi:hypothetical protein